MAVQVKAAADTGMQSGWREGWRDEAGATRLARRAGWGVATGWRTEAAAVRGGWRDEAG